MLSASIVGAVFADLNSDGLRSASEPGLAGVTVYLDANDNQLPDVGEVRVVTQADNPDTAANEAGIYQFDDLPDATYSVRIVTPSAPSNAVITVPSPTGFVVASGASNPAVGNVSPAGPITLELLPGNSTSRNVQITLPSGGLPFYDKIDVFLLMDDTGSFASLAPALAAQASSIVASIQAQLPGVSVAIGVARFEDFGGPLGSALYSENTTGRPFILSQPIAATSTADFTQAFSAALARTTPGSGGDGPEAIIEALYQTATGAGIDANNNGAKSDSGPAGLASTQTSPGSSGDVPAFSTFTPDAANHVLAPSGTLGGAGFRAGALPIILLATEAGTAYRDEGLTTITGAGRTLPLSSFTSDNSRASVPDYNFDGTPDGAGIQQAVTALNALGAIVVGLGTNDDVSSAPRQLLESLATVTGAFNRTGQSVNAGTSDTLAPNDPLYFRIDPGNAVSVANILVTAVVTAAKSAVLNVDVIASDSAAHITRVTPIETLNAPGQTASFTVSFTHDSPSGRRFDLQFINADTHAVLGSIPIVYSEYSQSSQLLVTTTAGQPVVDRLFGVGGTAPDLVARVTSNTLPVLAVPGDKGKITFTLTNQGNANATGNIDVKLSLSADVLLDVSDVALSTITGLAVNLAPGASTTITVDVTIPAVPVPGVLRVLVNVDAANAGAPSGAILEFSESNNLAISAPLDVAYRFGTFGTRKNVKLTYIDNDGTAAVFSLTGAGNAALIPHENDSPELLITGNDASTAVKIDVSKTAPESDGKLTLGGVLASAGSLKSFTAPAVNLVGNFTLPAGMLGSLVMANFTGDLELLGNGKSNSLTISAGRWDDVRVDAPHQVIKSLKLINWVSADESAINEIHALSIGSINSAGDFAAAIRLDATGNTLGKTSIAGQLSSAEAWAIAGSASTIVARAIGPFALNLAGDLAALSTTAGAISGASINARSIKSLSIKGDMIDAQIDLSMPASTNKKSLTTMTVTGTMRESTLSSAASLGAITVGAMDHAHVLVACDALDSLPEDPADFTNPATSIAALAIKGLGASPSFTNSFIAAAAITKITLAVVEPNNEEIPFGISSRKIGSYLRTGIAAMKNLIVPGTPDSSGDFELVIV